MARTYPLGPNQYVLVSWIGVVDVAGTSITPSMPARTRKSFQSLNRQLPHAPRSTQNAARISSFSSPSSAA